METCEIIKELLDSPTALAAMKQVRHAVGLQIVLNVPLCDVLTLMRRRSGQS
jgi:hypothetical protein